MILISHRGNIAGPNPERENDPVYVDEAIQAGYFVEIDLWVIDKITMLGHDKPQYVIDGLWLEENKQYMFIHCKNAEALAYCLHKFNGFWHENDDYALTMFGYVWCYPGKKPIGALSIAVMPEKVQPLSSFDKSGYFGVCSDFVELLNT